MPKIMSGDWSEAFSLPFVTGYFYNIHWGPGILDFTHMLIVPSYAWKSTDKSLILRFNYSSQRETHDINFLRTNKIKNNYTESLTNISLNGLTLGTSHHNNISKYLFLGIAGNINGSLILDRVICRKTCPGSPWVKEKDPGIKKWSDPTVWDNKVIPKDGDEVTIKGNWRMLLDVDQTPKLKKLIIDGDLIIDSARAMTTVLENFIKIINFLKKIN